MSVSASVQNPSPAEVDMLIERAVKAGGHNQKIAYDPEHQGQKGYWICCDCKKPFNKSLEEFHSKVCSVQKENPLKSTLGDSEIIIYPEKEEIYVLGPNEKAPDSYFKKGEVADIIVLARRALAIQKRERENKEAEPEAESKKSSE